MNTLRSWWKSILGYIKLLFHPLALLSLLALIAVTLMEFLWPSARHFFSTYPVTIGLITFLLTLIFTLSVVDRFVQKRAEQNWGDIRGITLKGLNDEVRYTRDILWIALFGEPPFGMSKQTATAVEKANRSRVRWPDKTGHEPGPRLTCLLEDGNWTETAKEMLRLATVQLREGIVRWAPMTALAQGDHKKLTPVAKLADVLEVLEFPFDDRQIDKKTKCIQRKFHEQLQALWLHALTTCVYVEENIVRDLYREGEFPKRPGVWQSQARRLLSGDGMRDLLCWLEDYGQFKRDTLSRESDVTDLLDWPW
jgi:hypothetical protein